MRTPFLENHLNKPVAAQAVHGIYTQETSFRFFRPLAKSNFRKLPQAICTPAYPFSFQNLLGTHISAFLLGAALAPFLDLRPLLYTAHFRNQWDFLRSHFFHTIRCRTLHRSRLSIFFRNTPACSLYNQDLRSSSPLQTYPRPTQRSFSFSEPVSFATARIPLL